MKNVKIKKQNISKADDCELCKKVTAQMGCTVGTIPHWRGAECGNVVRVQTRVAKSPKLGDVCRIRGKHDTCSS